MTLYSMHLQGITLARYPRKALAFDVRDPYSDHHGAFKTSLTKTV